MKARDALEAVNMGEEEWANCAIGQLSGGQKQRVAIAGALVENPQVLLLDELTTFLDRRNQEAVLRAVRHVLERRPTVTALWVTHRLEEVEHADSATYMEDGRVVMSGRPAEVVAFAKSRARRAPGAGVPSA